MAASRVLVVLDTSAAWSRGILLGFRRELGVPPGIYRRRARGLLAGADA